MYTFRQQKERQININGGGGERTYIQSFPHLRYYKLTLQHNYGASYYGPGAYLQEHYTPIFLNPSLLRTVYGITVTIYYALIVQTVSVFSSPTSIAM